MIVNRGPLPDPRMLSGVTITLFREHGLPVYTKQVMGKINEVTMLRRLLEAAVRTHPSENEIAFAEHLLMHLKGEDE